jgi:hypothetical protein
VGRPLEALLNAIADDDGTWLLDERTCLGAPLEVDGTPADDGAWDGGAFIMGGG